MLPILPEQWRKVNMSNEDYKRLILEMIKGIDDRKILVSIYTVVKNLIE